MVVEWGTIIIAAYGAILSTFNFLHARSLARRSLRVTAEFGFFPKASELGNQLVILRAINDGHRPLTINTPWLRTPDRKRMVLMYWFQEKQLPCRLHEGESCIVAGELEALKEQLSSEGYKGSVRLTPYFPDQTGRDHKGRHFRIDVV